MRLKVFKLSKRIRKVILISALVTILLLLSVFLYYLCRGYLLYRDVIGSRDVFGEIEDIRSRETYVGIDFLPRLYIDGVVIVEDRAFYTHGGLDYGAIAKAIVHNAASFSLSYGGSTITQQLAKNLFFTSEKKIERKAAEVFMVRLLEEHFTKRELLELYVNVIDFGSGCTGILEASFFYYGKHPEALSPEECAMLIGIPNSPECYSPLKDPVAAEEKKAFVISRLEKYGVWPKG